MQSNSTRSRCRKCCQTKQPADFDIGFTGKPYQTCRDCRSSYSRRAPGHWGDVAEKTCGGCDRLLPIDEFSFNAHDNGRSYRTSRCRECKAKAMAAWLTIPGNNKRSKLNKYGLTVADYETMFAAQGGACAICGDTVMPVDVRTGKPHALAVDHCHECKAVRSLLCPNCNNGLGCFRDDPKRLEKAIEYLTKHSHSP